ncbi:beta-lactamase-like protein [Pseudomassariella vexata]|uniref:Beta-lactamase-like protein n=1 Tax=Pseudomassariella vexata TaxID=1141098 RepID=A0A1Y2DR08_9PEZI|nr:beta-lactamase-like protein [Pseudomassariella vexata]ORY61701.1 beta-lactamase-like protein [Pseudomassariella vexata]
MSTFNGIIHEFPDIRVDFFRQNLDKRPPLACFLSHVHSDHLAGLETLRSPFVYCSAATREILLRLERYSCRINYAQGILEAKVQTYKHLKNLLKPIPLDTPTTLELAPGNNIQVTLLDANHCVGAVMFLAESDGKAVLYTGDIRSEPWWVNTIARNPSMVEYSTGLRTLDRIYLDTSILDDYEQQTKANGLRELLEKVAKYPDDTYFCMQAWTYGYEEVWIALSKALKSKIHVDKYKMGVYKSLVAKPTNDRFGPQFQLSKEAPYLVGFTCGNNQHDGCLTLDENVRIHSCEKGTACAVMQNKPVVWIQPIVARLPNGQDIAEVGIGGGGGDLEREAELDHLVPKDIMMLVQMIDDNDNIPVEVKEEMQAMFIKLLESGRSVSLNMDISGFPEDMRTNLKDIVLSMVKKLKTTSNHQQRGPAPPVQSLPTKITFSYARHSSYPELKHLVETLKPRDIWPCTVDVPYWHQSGITMQGYFGKYCSGDVFEHDIEMDKLLKEQLARQAQLQREINGEDSRRTMINPAQGRSGPVLPPTDALDVSAAKVSNNHPSQLTKNARTPAREEAGSFPADAISISSTDSSPVAPDRSRDMAPSSKRSYETFQEGDRTEEAYDDVVMQGGSQASSLSARAYDTRLKAYKAMESGDWSVGLISTTDHHSNMDPVLGERR